MRSLIIKDCLRGLFRFSPENWTKAESSLVDFRLFVGS